MTRRPRTVMLRRPLMAMLCSAGAVAACWPATAGARTLAPLNPTAPATTGTTPIFPLRDRVLRTRPGGARARIASTPERAYRAADGTSVNVALSDSFGATPGNEAAAQTYVDFLGTRLHSGELSRLHVFIGSPQEINTICGGEAGVLACYIGFERRMFVPSQDPTGGRSPFTREYVVTHELGHHIASFRRNDPFPALDWGPKYWSSYKHVCAGVVDGKFFPGNQGSHYLDDPGEGFADSYAHLHYPTVPWQYSPGLAPDEGAFAAIRLDVLRPWNGPKTSNLRRRFSGRRRTITIPVRFSLDGTIVLKLAGPRNSNFDLEVLEGRRVVKRTSARGSQDRLSGTACRDGITGTVNVRVRRRWGSGPFTLRVSVPG